VPAPAPRPTRTDAVILLGTAILAALAMLQADRDDRRYWVAVDAGFHLQTEESFLWAGMPEWLGNRRRLVERLRADLAATLTVSGIGLAALALRIRPRPRRREWLRPGVGAIALSNLVALLYAPHAAVVQASYGGRIAWPQTYTGPPIAHYQFFWFVDAYRIAMAILGAWIVAALAGRWRRRAGLAERLGRCLGWGWLVHLGAGALCLALWK